MGVIKVRLERIESEARFTKWFHTHRMFKAMNVEEFERLAATGERPIDQSRPREPAVWIRWTGRA